MINPPNTAHFESFDEDGKTIIPLHSSKLYKEDYLGLKKLEDENKLIFVSIDADHLRFST
jgi:palmitoyl-protein thioesterase